MFETVVPELVGRPSRRVFYETLPVSLAAHALAIGGILMASSWEVAFPSQSPRMTLAYSLISLPEPPPPPPPPPAPQPAAVVKPQALPKPAPPPPALTAIVAPTVIPDFIPQADEAPPAPPAAVEAPLVVEAAPHAAQAGDSKGIPGGDLLGKKFGAPGGIVFAEDGKVHVDRSVKLPLTEIEKGYPTYPDFAKKERLEDACVIRYTIGKNGRVIDVALIERAKDERFETISLDVIRRWRFRPMKVDGQAVEVIHEVEFFYQFTQR
jgi:TonB family protein